jgi:metal-responsive CopG/Arc/MetJ family transcriptional regulator
VSRSGPNIRDSERKRPPVRITLSREAIDRLDEIARMRGTSRSGAVEQLVRNARLGER